MQAHMEIGLFVLFRMETPEQVKIHPLCIPKVLVSQLCLTLCDPMDCSLPGSLVHGIFQGRIMEWLPCLPPEDLPDPGIKLCLKSPPFVDGFFTPRATWEAHPNMYYITIAIFIFLVFPSCVICV